MYSGFDYSRAVLTRGRTREDEDGLILNEIATSLCSSQ